VFVWSIEPCGWCNQINLGLPWNAAWPQQGTGELQGRCRSTSNWRPQTAGIEVLQVGALERCRRYGSAHRSQRAIGAAPQARLSLRRVSFQPRPPGHTQALQLARRCLAAGRLQPASRGLPAERQSSRPMPAVGAGGSGKCQWPKSCCCLSLER